ncbi:hypothetical protein DICPUDRAFT_51421 [Dictyostelium purpureum]|uniref:ribonucleoside-triphosphate reductase (thioredoxin) n=1 Tax=Dictyostelium purpureum TaxID=5786 RepID=F1A3P6_DICPU|nr:uncharacterized protein DICPUDRAFT_51421 [Dictyostelium purpureum]EGC29184.1 hypothetical protein DICPUDRAFT_51421 [Dictyostelium purpureum]|eukprot:XP_003294292.1 hypothetical protein DICPUDRAFT_51421 [Dictyostelium purpureum]
MFRLKRFINNNSSSLNLFNNSIQHVKYSTSSSSFNNLLLNDDGNEIKSNSSYSSLFLTNKGKNTDFKLNDQFIEEYRKKKAKFGFGILGEIVYRRTYSRVKPDTNTNEKWYETVERVVNGTYNMQKRWIESHGLSWNDTKAQSSAQEMYRKIFEMKFLPPGRGLWAMGSPITEKKGLYAALNNCAFVSTMDMKDNPTKPFIFLMDASMLGVGVGFDCRGANSFIIKGQSKRNCGDEMFIIPDSREGWVQSVQILLDSYFLNKPKPQFDYSKIRKKGEPIKGFGGVCSGYQPLQELHYDISNILDESTGKPISITNIVDLMNLIGKCVVSGSVRQSAEIAFGDPNSTEYINLKNYKANPHRQAFGWTSNNSVFAEIGMEYDKICERIIENGEPGFAFLENMKSYSRMIPSEKDFKDSKALGGNPCLEQTLESYELCCLVETFPNNHDSLEEYLSTLKYAFLYSKTVTLGATQWPDTNRVLLRNRRIGCSMSGIAQFIQEKGLNELREWCLKGYDYVTELDNIYSDWLAIPKSIKKTSIKPSGTVSLLAGATPGMHYPISEYYIRRIRIHKGSDLLPELKHAGYHIEEALDNVNNMVVEIPIHSGKNIRSANSISIWEQLSLAAFLQKHWADNQVSSTVSFNPATEGPQLKHALNYFQYQLKGVSFLPNTDLNSKTIYTQMPYEPIDEEKYKELTKNLKPVSFENSRPTEPEPDKYCDSNNCTVLSQPNNLNNLE